MDQAYCPTMKKRKNAHRRLKADSKSVTTHRALWLGAAIVVVVLIVGISVAMVQDDAASTTASTPTASTMTNTPQRNEPQVQITPAPQSGDAPLTITVSDPTDSTTPPSPLKITMNPPASVPATGTVAPDFTLQDLNGRPVQLSRLRGKVVVVNFWATWCGPCKAEIPGFINVYNKYKRRGLEIIGVSLDTAGPDVVAEFVKKYSINYPVALDKAATAQKYGGVTGIPTTFIVDRQGRIAKRHVGYMDQTAFEQMLSPFL